MSVSIEEKAYIEELNSFSSSLLERCNSVCELCNSDSELSVYEVKPSNSPDINKCIMLCSTCRNQIENKEEMNVNHWHCLSETAWTEVPAVQVMVLRTLKSLQDQSWAQELLEQLYISDEVKEWADAEISTGDNVITKDSNGTVLNEGDSVAIIKDLDVKGTSFVAKRGTVVKNIRLTGNPEHIEGKVNGTGIVLKTCFLKKLG
jgi:protein PhnA